MIKTNEYIITVNSLTMGYSDRIVMRNLNFSVFENEIFIILGGSGCGKSTLLKHMIGLHCPIEGSIRIQGEEISCAPEEQKRNIMKRFGVLYQSSALFGSLTVAENVSLPLEEHTSLTRKEIQERISEKLRLVDLQGFEKYMPHELSGGMKKRAGLARAMALNPSLLFLDEPSAGLDPISSASLDELLLRLRNEQGTAMVIVTHELDSIFTIADRVIFLDKESKTSIALGNPHELREAADHPFVRRFLNRGKADKESDA